MDKLQLKSVDAVTYDDKGATLVLSCGHRQYLENFPRGPIPPCFRRHCKECLN